MDTRSYEDLTGLRLASQRDNWRGICPAHLENTPSFFIHKDTFLCHCFGCGIKGYLDTVLAKCLEIPASQIRDKLDIPLLKERRPQAVEKPLFTKAWLEAYPRISMHPVLRKRGFKSDIVLLCGARWDPSGRIVFPLRTLGSRVEGAVGRSVKDNLIPKWYFYWETRPGDILYQPQPTLHVNIIVEGIFDLMWLWQHGYAGAAALLSAGATQKQIDLIKAETDEVLLFLDNDKAGRIGQERLYKELRNSLKVTFANYPEGKKDPPELSEKELHEAIETRLTRVEYSGSY